MIFRSLILSLAFCALGSGPAQGYQPYPQPHPPGFAGMQQWASPNQVLSTAFDRLSAFVSSPAINNPLQATAFLETEMAPLFDFEFMANWAARPYYQRMNPQQRELFRQGMKQRFVELIIKGMGPYINPLPRVRFHSARFSGPGQADVPMEVFVQPGVSLRGYFHLRLSPNGWKIVDASMNGISGLNMFRQFLIQRVREQGPAALLP